MYIVYIDESGDTIPLSQKGKKHLVLTGCIIHESNIQKIERTFRMIKERYYQDPDIEIKSNFLRYANPDISFSSPMKLNSLEKYDQLEAEVTSFLKELPVTLYSIVIDKQSYWNQYPSQNPYMVAYVFLLERFQKFLKGNDSLGISIIDPREGQVEKHYIGNELLSMHEKMRWHDGSIWTKCDRVVEKLLFSQSDATTGIQIADLFCYPIYHLFEYNKNPSDYWRYEEITKNKLYRYNGKLINYGLKVFPDKTKKDLSSFDT